VLETLTLSQQILLPSVLVVAAAPIPNSPFPIRLRRRQSHTATLRRSGPGGPASTPALQLHRSAALARGAASTGARPVGLQAPALHTAPPCAPAPVRLSHAGTRPPALSLQHRSASSAWPPRSARPLQRGARPPPPLGESASTARSLQQTSTRRPGRQDPARGRVAAVQHQPSSGSGTASSKLQGPRSASLEPSISSVQCQFQPRIYLYLVIGMLN
jgi:hypothetical protein